jgi:hypothetical protein
VESGGEGCYGRGGGGSDALGQKQIPSGNDRKKSKSKNKAPAGAGAFVVVRDSRLAFFVLWLGGGGCC